MIEKEIPQRLWEDYVQYRDRMTVLQDMGINQPEWVNREWGELNEKVHALENQYGWEYLGQRYRESLG